MLPPTRKGYLKKPNPSPYRPSFPDFRSNFAQKPYTFTHFFRITISQDSGQTGHFAWRCKTLIYAIGRQKSEGGGGVGGVRERKGSLCDICHFDLGDLTVVCRGFPVKFFPLDFENKFYCFFDIGERFFPGSHPG